MAIKGLDSFLDVLELIRDPAKYESKVQELQALVKQYTEVAEAVVKLSEVNDYTRTIREREAKSKDELLAAKEEATKIRAAAREYNRAQVAQTDKVRDDLVAKSVKLEQKEIELNNTAVALEQERKILSEKMQSLDSYEKGLRSLEAELQARQKRLLDAIK